MFELAEPAQTEPSIDPSGPPPHKDRQPALITMMELLTDIVSGMETKIEMVGSLKNMVAEMQTKLLRQFQTLEDKLTKLQGDRAEEFHEAEDWHWPADLPAPVLPSLPDGQTPPQPLESTALADVSNRSVGIGHGVPVDTYTIPQDVVDLCLNVCKSRRNLAGRLAS